MKLSGQEVAAVIIAAALGAVVEFLVLRHLRGK